VWAKWTRREFLPLRQRGIRAVDGGRGRDHHMLDSRRTSRLEDVERAVDVDCVAGLRILETSRHRRARTKVDDRGGTSNRSCHGFDIAQVALDRDHSLVTMVSAPARRVVVERDDLSHRLLEEQPRHEVCANEPTATGYDYLHLIPHSLSTAG